MGRVCGFGADALSSFRQKATTAFAPKIGDQIAR